MHAPRGLDGTLLLLAAACLFFGGGFGCEEDNDGVSFRAAEIMGDRYYGITGKKEPGAGSLRFPYELDPPFYGKVNIGIFNPVVLTQTADAVGYGQLEREDQVERYRIEARYELSPAGLRFTSNIDANDAFCPGVTRAFLRIDDDAVNALLRYKCALPDDWSTLTTTPSLFTVGEGWYWRVGAFDLGKKAQIGFDHYRVDSAAPTAPSAERQAAFAMFDFFHFSLRAFERLEIDELSAAQGHANTALGALSTARGLVESGIADFDGSGVEKTLIKADKTFFKAYEGLFEGKEAGYLKSYTKVAMPTTWALYESIAFY
jgi:hypothetical protein